MAVITSTFGGWKLTGRDAKQMSEYLAKHEYEAPYSKEAASASMRGKGMANDLRSKGYVSVSLPKK